MLQQSLKICWVGLGKKYATTFLKSYYYRNCLLINDLVQIIKRIDGKSHFFFQGSDNTASDMITCKTHYLNIVTCLTNTCTQKLLLNLSPPIKH